MKPPRYSQREKDFLRENAHRGFKWCAIELGRPHCGVKRIASKLKIKSGADTLHQFVMHRANLKQQAKILFTCKVCRTVFIRKKFQCKKGKPFQYCSRVCHYSTLGGSGNPGWKGGKHQSYTDRLWEMAQPKYESWRLSVFQRDNFACQKCGVKNKTLNAHHIVFWRDSVELRYVLSNGVTLCGDCHTAVHKGTK